MRQYISKISLLGLLSLLCACDVTSDSESQLEIVVDDDFSPSSVVQPLLLKHQAESVDKKDKGITELKTHHCLSSETIVFQCNIKNKVLSVCGLSDKTLSYRFGEIDKLEKRIDALALTSGQSFSGGFESRLTFNEGNFSYIVYDNLIKNMQSGKSSHIKGGGIYVVQKDKLLAQLRCEEYIGKAFMSSVEFNAMYAPQEQEYIFFDDEL